MTSPNLNLDLPLGTDIARLFASEPPGQGEDELNDQILRTFSQRPTTLSTWTPTVNATTPPNFGNNAIIFGRYFQFNNGIVMAYATLGARGSGISAGSGSYRFTLPVDIDKTVHSDVPSIGKRDVLGFGWIRDNSNIQNSMLVLPTIPTSVNDNEVWLLTDTYAGKSNALVVSGIPFSLAVDDAYSFMVTYQGII